METFLFWLDDFGANLAGWAVIGIDIALIYGLYRLIKHFIRYHAECQNDFAERRERERRSQRVVDEVNRELDEIEASLDAMAEIENSDGKITPIWNAKPPKR